MSCATSGLPPAPPVPVPVASDFCLIAEPIFFDPADRMTRTTEAKIIAHNEKGKKLCDWTPPS